MNVKTTAMLKWYMCLVEAVIAGSLCYFFSPKCKHTKWRVDDSFLFVLEPEWMWDGVSWNVIILCKQCQSGG